MKRFTDLLFAWSGAAFVLFFFVGLLLLADFVPPPSPASSAEEIAAIYRDRTEEIRIGAAFAFVGTMFFLMFGAGLTRQTRRIPGASPALPHLQTACVSAAAIVIIIPIICWWAAAFRPVDRDPELILLLNDVSWLLFVVGFAPYVTWAIAVGLAILSDTARQPLFPRWSGYLSILVGTLQVPPILLVFFKTGPFAWDGLISWWVPMFDFFIWIVVMITLSVRAARGTADRTEGPAAVAASAP